MEYKVVEIFQDNLGDELNDWAKNDWRYVEIICRHNRRADGNIVCEVLLKRHSD